MAENKHTAGPWVSDNERPTVYAADGFSICDVDDWCLHAAFDGTTHPATTPGATIDRPREEVVANARLIAAAPDLLEFAVALDADWTREFPDGPETKLAFGKLADETVALWKQCRAAIAKARGEQ